MEDKNICLILSELAKALREARELLTEEREVSAMHVEINERLRREHSALSAELNKVREKLNERENELFGVRERNCELDAQNKKLADDLEDLDFDLDNRDSYIAHLEDLLINQYGVDEAYISCRRVDCGVELP